MADDLVPADVPTVPPLLASLLERLPEPHILFDRDYRILAANAAYRAEFGDDPIVGRSCYAVSHHADVPCDRAGESCPLAAALASGQREKVLHLHRLPTGSYVLQDPVLGWGFRIAYSFAMVNVFLAVFNLIPRVLDLNGNLTVFGGADDPNRYPGSLYGLPSPVPGGAPETGVKARLTDFTFDRLPPVALMQVGARLRVWQERITISTQFYNVLNQNYYYPDVFFDQAPIIEMRPNPATSWSFFSSVTLKL